MECREQEINGLCNTHFSHIFLCVVIGHSTNLATLPREPARNTVFPVFAFLTT